MSNPTARSADWSPAAVSRSASRFQPLRRPPLRIAPGWVALLLGAWCTALLNQAWWQRLAQLASEQPLGLWEKALVAVVITAATALWFLLLSWRRVRWIGWTASLMAAAAMQHFMVSYGTVMDSSMLRNALHTNRSEAAALLSMGMLWHVILYAGLPVLLLRMGVAFPAESTRRSVLRSAMLTLACLATTFVGTLLLYKPMAPLVRNHTEIRYLINPLAGITSLANVTLKPLLHRPRAFRRISDDVALGATYGTGQGTPHAALAGTDSPAPAIAPPAAPHKPPLLVLVVGETTRADHFGLNGYPRNTTARMEERHVISWRNVRSCGTNTLASVPCMFSHLGKDGFEGRQFDYENLLDVLQRSGLQVDWLDNQSGCKDVCNRVSHTQAMDIATPAQRARWCADGECLDQLMVEQLDQRLAAATQQPTGAGAGVVLVLHQMGSHGPAYHRRSSAENKRFQPECQTQAISDCAHSALVNVYDNSMAETDHFVSRTIDWLRTQESQYETGLIYLSDHGESLGENGLYLHGLPYLIAPDVQKIVPWVLWPGTLLQRTAVSERCVRAGLDTPLTHDNFFHTVLGLLDVHSGAYRRPLDALANCRA
jgi:lipid A ethanolaminephosphotransferase